MPGSTPLSSLQPPAMALTSRTIAARPTSSHLSTSVRSIRKVVPVTPGAERKLTFSSTARTVSSTITGTCTLGRGFSGSASGRAGWKSESALLNTGESRNTLNTRAHDIARRLARPQSLSLNARAAARRMLRSASKSPALSGEASTGRFGSSGSGAARTPSGGPGPASSGPAGAPARASRCAALSPPLRA